MRKRTLRCGMSLVLAALIVIIIASFYLDTLAAILSLSINSEMRLYRWGIFWAAAMGGYGVVLSAFGLVLPGTPRDSGIRIAPMFLMIIAVVSLFTYLLAASFDVPFHNPRERNRSGDVITI